MSNLRLRLFWDATLAVDRAMTWSLKSAEWTVLARSSSPTCQEYDSKSKDTGGNAFGGFLLT